jgi:hypothetical protein
MTPSRACFGCSIRHSSRHDTFSRVFRLLDPAQFQA